jgi:hypothetical protein
MGLRRVGEWKMLNDGLPTKKRLVEIGLDDAAADLAKMGKLGECEYPAINELLGKKN